MAGAQLMLECNVVVRLYHGHVVTVAGDVRWRAVSITSPLILYHDGPPQTFAH